MSTLWPLLIAVSVMTIFEYSRTYSENNKNVQKDDYRKMKRRLLKLLRKDGFQYEMNEGRIILTYRQEHFVVHFDASQFGERYARVTIADQEASEDKHIGFKTPSDEPSEEVPQVAAETNVKTE